MGRISKDFKEMHIDEIDDMVKEAIKENDRAYLIDILDVVQKKIDLYSKEVRDIDSKIYEAKTLGKDIKEINHNTATAEDYAEMMSTKVSSYRKLKDYIIEEYWKLKNFNKVKAVENIQYLLEQNQELKIGMLEKSAQVGLGYLSRLRKSDNLTDPSVEFIVTAAKLLNVSVDYLISADVDGESKELTPAEVKILDFVNRLFDDTSNGDLIWYAFDKDNLRRRKLDYNETNKYPFLNYQFEASENNGMICCFKSSFAPEMPYDYNGEIYEARLQRLDAMVYILPIRYWDPYDTSNVMNEFELYIIKDNKLIPICGTYKMKMFLKNRIVELYKKICMFDSSTKLSKDANNVLDEYLNMIDLPFK